MSFLPTLNGSAAAAAGGGAVNLQQHAEQTMLERLAALEEKVRMREAELDRKATASAASASASASSSPARRDDNVGGGGGGGGSARRTNQSGGGHAKARPSTKLRRINQPPDEEACTIPLDINALTDSKGTDQFLQFDLRKTKITPTGGVLQLRLFCGHRHPHNPERPGVKIYVLYDELITVFRDYPAEFREWAALGLFSEIGIVNDERRLLVQPEEVLLYLEDALKTERGRKKSPMWTKKVWVDVFGSLAVLSRSRDAALGRMLRSHEIGDKVHELQRDLTAGIIASGEHSAYKTANRKKRGLSEGNALAGGDDGEDGGDEPSAKRQAGANGTAVKPAKSSKAAKAAAALAADAAKLAPIAPHMDKAREMLADAPAIIAAASAAASAAAASPAPLLAPLAADPIESQALDDAVAAILARARADEASRAAAANSGIAPMTDVSHGSVGTLSTDLSGFPPVSPLDGTVSRGPDVSHLSLGDSAVHDSDTHMGMGSQSAASATASLGVNALFDPLVMPDTVAPFAAAAAPPPPPAPAVAAAAAAAPPPPPPAPEPVAEAPVPMTVDSDEYAGGAVEGE